jgi:5-methylcytosine-specific restriction endonuclease McrA
VAHKDPAQARAYQEKWRRENTHRLAGYRRTYVATEKGKATVAAVQRRYASRNREHVRVVNSTWLAAHPEYETARAKRRWADPVSREKQRGYNQICEQRRRVAEKAPGEAALTTEQWREIKAWFDGRCAYCFALTPKPEIDHIIPVSRGGLHVASNVAPACRWCNRSKNGRDLVEWLFPKKRGHHG